MVNLTLKPLNAIGGKDLESNSINGIKISEENVISLASIGCSSKLFKSLSRKMKTKFNVSVPGPGKSLINQKIRVSWTAQGQWFLESPDAFNQGFANYLVEKLGKDFAITEQSDGWVKVSISGETVLKVLEKCIILDLNKMSDGSFSRCSLDHIGVYLLCERVKKSFVIYGPRSSAKSLHHALIQAAYSL